MTNVPGSSRRIAVVGGGVAGLTTAWMLARSHDVVLMEASDYVGGHTRTITLARGPDAGMAVDTGFIVMNHRNYPILSAILEKLAVGLSDSEMSFSFHCENTGFYYGSNGASGVFAQPANILRPSFLRLLLEIGQFQRRARRDVRSGTLGATSLDDYVRGLRFSPAFHENYLAPMAAAIWSSPPNRIGEFPAQAFLRFFDHHGLLSPTDAPTWKFVRGGSKTYVEAMLATFRGEVRLKSPVQCIRRHEQHVEVTSAERKGERFDDVVIATHADQALEMLEDPSPDEQRLLGVWEYSVNHAVLHTDASVLPPGRRAWASWNYTRERQADGAAPVSVTYYMNRLQRLETPRHYCVTLNRSQSIRDEHVLDRMTYTHPHYTSRSMASQAELPTLNGARNTWFCGSYFGYGFHEDAARSAVAVVRDFGLDL